ncbi:replication factor A protein 3 [Purpureocillium lavendulum]|uniref:Replication factor A protein 3 n=1 Tax=Purpureocillium lavendulum TaxID=1247861 RepID=A0AB34FJ91_9HYPO|nr:replication factor A protein 3 [Purpureocillium lavendulum]
MKSYLVAALSFAVGAMSQQALCPGGLYGNALCCDTDVLGVVDIDCTVPNTLPTSGDNFREVCASNGKTARCCALPVLRVIVTIAIEQNSPHLSAPRRQLQYDFRMKASILGLISDLAVLGTSLPSADRTFVRLALEDPPNWFANDKLTARIIDGFSEIYNQSTADAWAQSILDKCQANTACTSSVSLSADNFGTGRLWYGYLFKGGATTPADYVRMDGKVQDSVVYTVAQ